MTLKVVVGSSGPRPKTIFVGLGGALAHGSGKLDQIDVLSNTHIHRVSNEKCDISYIIMA